MTVSAKWYQKAFMKVLNKEVDWDTDDIKVMLCTNAYTPDQAAHDYKSDVDNEVTDDGYTAGGATLASKTIALADSVITLDAADVTWENASITARYAVIYSDAGATDADKVLLGYADFGQDMISSSGDFKIAWSASGIFTITVG